MSVKHIYDLSVTLETYMPLWPTNPLLDIKPVSILPRDGYNAEIYHSSTHTGTHIDAPYHMIENGNTIDKIELNKLVGEGYSIKIEVKGNEIDANALRNKWKEEYDGKFILLNTGWYKKRSFTKEFLYDFPGLSEDAADFLIEHKIKLIGIDTLGIEPYAHQDFKVHKKLLSNEITIIEDLANLDQLIEGKKYLIVALPLKIKNASGSMARVIAIDME